MIISGRKNTFLFCLILVWIFLLFSIYFLIKAFNLKRVDQYSEKSTVEYSVCLNKNDFYKEECLSEEQEYLSSLTNEIRILFNYNRVYVEDTKSDLNYHIISRLKIYSRENNREIYRDDRELTKLKTFNGDKKVYNVQDNISISLEDFTDVVNKYVRDYGVNSRAELEVLLNVGEKGSEENVASLTIPLMEQTYSIEKNTVEKKADENLTTQMRNYLFVSILLFLMDIVIVIVSYFRFSKNKHVSAFDLEVNRLLTDYDRIIVETKDSNVNYENKEITELDDFMELVDVRDTLEKPILYLKQSEEIRDFVVQDQKVLYRYRMDSKNYISEEVDKKND